jgi:hypothetical protein
LADRLQAKSRSLATPQQCLTCLQQQEIIEIKIRLRGAETGSIWFRAIFLLPCVLDPHRIQRRPAARPHHSF